MYPLLHEVNYELHSRISDMSFVLQTPSKKTYQNMSLNHYKMNKL